ncbi:MAG: signal peptidase II [Gammaproteobacteria bacterium AqS3]|nr:signal peptidase II [Gammaproteobacteria bacterium AqS3]
MPEMRGALIAWAGAAAIAGVDLWLKSLAEAHLSLGESGGALIPGVLELFLVHNTGAAFGWMAGVGGAAPFLIGVSLLASLLFGYFIWHSAQMDASRQRTWTLVAFAMLLGGALGNLYDRIVHGHVIDYLHLHLADSSMFVFNLADALLSVGVGIVLLLQYLGMRQTSEAAD